MPPLTFRSNHRGRSLAQESGSARAMSQEDLEIVRLAYAACSGAISRPWPSSPTPLGV